MNFYEATFLYNLIHPLKSQFFDHFFMFISFLFNNGYLPITTGVILLFFKKHRRTGIRILISLTIGIIIGNGILKPLIARTRPFYVLGIEPVVKAPQDFSFPSGHTQAAFAFATSVFVSHKKQGIFCLVLATIVGFSRLYLLVHYPTDIVFGAILGISWGMLAESIINKFHKKKL
ncbi:MAG: phosphatase PAP2 family protein [Clostridia bacterium]|nr:phosphatase PAP2 family protein [Clostridia bacterium]